MLGSDINEKLLVLLGIDIVTPIVFQSFELITVESLGWTMKELKHMFVICYGHLFI